MFRLCGHAGGVAAMVRWFLQSFAGGGWRLAPAPGLVPAPSRLRSFSSRSILSVFSVEPIHFGANPLPPPPVTSRSGLVQHSDLFQSCGLDRLGKLVGWGGRNVKAWA